MLCHQCTCKCLETGPFYKEFILGAPRAVSRSARPLETQRTLPVPGNSDRDLIFRLYNYCVFNLRTTSERHQDFSQNDHLSTKTHRRQTIHPICAAFQVIDLIAICSTHGLIFPVPSNTVKLFRHVSTWPRHGIRNGYDVADSSSDVDATSSIVQTIKNHQTPRHKYEDRRLEITWFARGITIYKLFFFPAQLCFLA